MVRPKVPIKALFLVAIISYNGYNIDKLKQRGIKMNFLLSFLFLGLIIILIKTIYDIHKRGNNKKYDEKLAEELFKGYINHYQKDFDDLDDTEKDNLFYQGVINTYKSQIETSKKVLKNHRLILIIGYITIFVCAISLTVSFFNKNYLMILFLAMAITINIAMLENLKRSARNLRKNIYDMKKYIENNLQEYMDRELKSELKDIK